MYLHLRAYVILCKMKYLKNCVRDLHSTRILLASNIFRFATVREKVLENEKFSRSGKSQGITFSVEIKVIQLIIDLKVSHVYQADSVKRQLEKV